MGIWSEIKETVEDVVEGVADWFTREEEMPEILVLGAELHCMYGSKNTYLIVNEENMRFNGLPAACVLDRAESDNIMYFGVCHQNGYCSDLMKLRKRWENEEPQDVGLNGEEFITTESVLICERCGGRIQAVNSGQDRIGAERLNQELILLARMQDQYPGLLEVISDPNGSLYLTEGMYDKAMAFVRECWENNGCNMEIISLFDQSSPEREMMRNVMERLLKSFDMSAVDKFRDDLSWKGTEKGYDGVPGWNVDVLNQEMFLLLEDECEITKKRLEEESFYRLREEHRNFMYTLSDAATLLSYFVVANKGFGSNKGVDGPGEDTNTLTDRDTNTLRDKDAKTISNMSKEELKAALPEGWSYSEHNGRVHIKDVNGNYRVRIDPPDSITNYQHMHIYDEHQNSLDIHGNIVDYKSSNAHIPWDK